MGREYRCYGTYHTVYFAHPSPKHETVFRSLRGPHEGTPQRLLPSLPRTGLLSIHCFDANNFVQVSFFSAREKRFIPHNDSWKSANVFSRDAGYGSGHACHCIVRAVRPNARNPYETIDVGSGLLWAAPARAPKIFKLTQTMRGPLRRHAAAVCAQEYRTNDQCQQCEHALRRESVV
jgi:hypothetical protein